MHINKRTSFLSKFNFHLGCPRFVFKNLALISIVFFGCQGLLKAQFLETSSAKIQLIGLTSRTPESFDQEIIKRFDGHYCAANLKQGLGYAEAAVFVYPATDNSKKLHLVVVLVEDSEKVVYNKFNKPKNQTLPEDHATLERFNSFGMAPFNAAIRGYQFFWTKVFPKD